MSPTLDKFVPAEGYTLPNTWVISKLANAIKNNGTPEQVLKVAGWMQIVARFQRTLTQKQFVEIRERVNGAMKRAAEKEMEDFARAIA